MRFRTRLFLASVCVGLVIYLALTVMIGSRQAGTFQGHTESVSWVICSPDGKTLASGSQGDRTIRLWDVAGQRERAVIPAPTDDAFAAFSADGSALASWSNKTVIVWNVRTGEQQTTFRGHANKVNCVAFSPDGKTLASVSHARINLLNLTSGECRVLVNCHCDENLAITFSPDGKRLASASQSRIHFWDLATGTRHDIEDIHCREVFAITFSRDGKTLCWGGDAAVVVWDLATAKEHAVFPVPKWDYYVRKLVFSPDSKTLASARFVGRDVKVLDLVTRQERIFPCPQEIDPMDDPTIGTISFSPDGKTLAANVNNTVGFWHVASGKNTGVFAPDHHLREFPRPLRLSLLSLFGSDDQIEICSVQFTPQGDCLAIGRRGRMALMWTAGKSRP